MRFVELIKLRDISKLVFQRWTVKKRLEMQYEISRNISQMLCDIPALSEQVF